MFYVRHTAQTRKSTDQLAWDYAKKLHCDLDIYDDDKRSVVWGTYRLARYVEVDGKQVWEILGYSKALPALRRIFAETRPETWSVSHYDWKTRKWTSVAHS